MIWSLLGAVAASVCFGVATVLQAMSARAAPSGRGVDPRVLVRLMRQAPFLAGIGLDILGFVAELAALRSLPLFVVQAAIAANLAVTAVLATRVLGVTLSAPEWAAVGAVCVGLALLGLAAGQESPANVSVTFRLVLLACVGALAALGTAVGRLRGRLRSAALGLVAGLSFGLVAIGARVLTSLAPWDLLRDPATYVVAAAGGVALLFFATALQRGSVATTTAAVVVAETVVPALIGILALGDRTRPGLAPIAVAGFVMAVAGALVLARFGEPAHPQETASAPRT